jgi:hypothetical protein
LRKLTQLVEDGLALRWTELWQLFDNLSSAHKGSITEFVSLDGRMGKLKR